MDSTLWVALFSLLGTLIGTLGGIVASSKLVNHRLTALEKQVEKHNSVVERQYIIEGEVRELQHEVKELKTYHQPHKEE